MDLMTTVCGATVLFFSLSAGVTFPQEQEAEPAQVLILSVDGKDYTFEENQQKKILEKFENATFSFRSAGYRVFRYAGLTFRYPEGLEFDAEHNGDDKTWDIIGDDADLSILFLNGDPESYFRASIDELLPATDFPKQNVALKSGSLKLGGEEFETYEYALKWDDKSSIHTWALSLPVRDGKSRVLMFGREYKNGKLKQECEELEKMVLGSLKLVD
jgi:hypothetical protein